MLTEAAIESRCDRLIGLKENIIIGKLIPAGTGMQPYRDVETEAPDYQPLAVLLVGGPGRATWPAWHGGAATVTTWPTSPRPPAGSTPRCATRTGSRRSCPYPGDRARSPLGSRSGHGALPRCGRRSADRSAVLVAVALRSVPRVRVRTTGGALAAPGGGWTAAGGQRSRGQCRGVAAPTTCPSSRRPARRDAFGASGPGGRGPRAGGGAHGGRALVPVGG